MSAKHAAVGIFGLVLLAQITFIQVLLYTALIRDDRPQAPIEVRIVTQPAEAVPASIGHNGSLKRTGKPLDLAIDGRGFFQIELPDGGTTFTRHGDFHIGPDGTIMNAQGFPLVPSIAVPEDYTSLEARYDGTVSVRLADGNLVDVGSITLARFMNPDGLRPWRSDGLLVETEASGAPTEGAPGSDGFGSLEQGYLERPQPGSLEASLTLPSPANSNSPS